MNPFSSVGTQIKKVNLKDLKDRTVLFLKGKTKEKSEVQKDKEDKGADAGDNHG